MDEEGCPLSFPIENERHKIVSNNDYKKLPSQTIAYWLSDNMKRVLTLKSNLGDYCSPRLGMATADNDRFMRNWFEVNFDNIAFGCKSRKEALETKKKWFPYNKGGAFRRWYGNNDYVVNWENDGYEIRNFKDSKGKVRSHNYNLEQIFEEGITWTFLSSSRFSSRYFENGFLSDSGGSFLTTDHKYVKYIEGLLSTNMVDDILNILNPTMSYQAGNIASIPFIFDDSKLNKINEIVDECILLTKKDWNYYETSYDFRNNPIIEQNDCNIRNALTKHSDLIKKDFNRLKELEEENNKIFNDIYGFNNEIKIEVNDKYVSYSQVDELRDIKALISYAVGCMFGRYSLDKPGIVCGGNSINKNNYNIFVPDDDNIIPISDSDDIYYNDDIVGKFKEFIKTAFGQEELNDNLNYIADVLGKRGTESSEETIRRYFINDFYNDHLKMYQKRPIYFMFDSGKKNGFKCLVYVHRYNEQIVSKIRTKYLHNTLAIYQRCFEEINYKINNESMSINDKRELQNKLLDLENKINECNEYEEMVGNVANKMIKLDLDDGVVINYAKFVDDNGKSILAKIK